MKRRVFSVEIPQNITDFRNDELLLAALEVEIKLASRFFTIVDFVTENIDPNQNDPESRADRELMATLGHYHWRRARRIIKERRQLMEDYGKPPGSDDELDEPDMPAPTLSRR